MSSHSTDSRVRYKSLTFLGFPKYRIGNDGTVWSRHYRNEWTKLELNVVGRGGHLGIHLSEQGKKKPITVHRLVLLAFVGPPGPNMQACHNDGNPQNNCLDNLRWASCSENRRDQYWHGTSVHGERNPRVKLKAVQVEEIRRLYATGKFTQRSLAKMFKVCNQTICDIVHNQHWKPESMLLPDVQPCILEPLPGSKITTEIENGLGVTYKSLDCLGDSYRIGDDGSIWTKKKKMGTWKRMRECTTRTGHQVVGLHKDGKPFTRSIHRLVLEAFEGPCPEGMECCHNNGNASDNRLENLRWDTPKNNCRDRGNYGVAKLTEKEVREIRKLYATGAYTMQALSDKYNVNVPSIHAVVRRKSWQHIEGGIPENKGDLRAKLTEEDVATIRSLHGRGQYTTAQLAKQFDVTPTRIWQIVSNKPRKY